MNSIGVVMHRPRAGMSRSAGRAVRIAAGAPCAGIAASFFLLHALVVSAALLCLPSAPARADDQKPEVTGRNSAIQLSGVGWVVYRYKAADEPALEAPGSAIGVAGQSLKGANSFDIDRVYVTADYAFNDRYAWQTVLEGANLGGNLSLFVKRAFLRIKTPFHVAGTAFRFGQIGHVMTGQVEDVWGYRIVSKVPIDRYLGVSTTWLGAGVEAQPIDGYLDMDLAVANDKAYNVPQGAATVRDKYKSLMGRVTFVPLPDEPTWKGLRVSFFGQYGAKYPQTAGLPVDASHNQTRWWGVFPSFKADHYSAGFEFYRKYDRNGAAAPDGFTETSSQYIGGFASGDLTARDRVFLRLDRFDPDRSKDNNGFLTLIGGVSHAYVKGVRMIVDGEYSKFDEPAGTSYKGDLTLSARAEVAL